MPKYIQYHDAKTMPARDLRRGDVVCIPEGVYRVIGVEQYDAPVVGTLVLVQVETLFGVTIGRIVRLLWERINCAEWTREDSPEAVATTEGDVSGSTCTLCGHRGSVEHSCPALNPKADVLDEALAEIGRQVQATLLRYVERDRLPEVYGSHNPPNRRRKE